MLTHPKYKAPKGAPKPSEQQPAKQAAKQAEKRPVGRPPDPDREPRYPYQILLTAEERERLWRLAKASRAESVAAYVRDRLGLTEPEL